MSMRESIVPIRRAATPVMRPTVVSDADEKRLIDALRLCVRNATGVEFDKRAESVRRDVFSGQMLPARHLLLIARNAFERGAPESDLLAFSDEYAAVVSSWYRTNEAPSDLAAAHLNEELAEGAMDAAQVEYAYSRSPGTAQKLLDCARTYTVALARLIRCTRQPAGAAR